MSRWCRQVLQSSFTAPLADIFSVDVMKCLCRAEAIPFLFHSRPQCHSALLTNTQAWQVSIIFAPLTWPKISTKNESMPIPIGMGIVDGYYIDAWYIEDRCYINTGSCLVGNNVSLSSPTNDTAIGISCRCVILLCLQYQSLSLVGVIYFMIKSMKHFWLSESDFESYRAGDTADSTLKQYYYYGYITLLLIIMIREKWAVQLICFCLVSFYRCFRMKSKENSFR